MARKVDLMGLGESPFLAARMATDPSIVNSQGASRASATQLGGTQYFVCVTGSNSGSGIALPPVGGDNGALLGDDFIINNQLVGTIQVYGPVGSTISYSAGTGGGGTLISGSAGVDIQSHNTSTFWPITATSWLGIRGG